MNESSKDWGTRGSVLLTELEPKRSREIAAALRAAGFFVTEACGMEQLLAAFTEQPYDVMLFDVGGPGRAGLELLRKVVEHQLAFSPIVTTARPRLDLVVDVMRVGAVDLLIEPIALPELIERVAAGVIKGKHRRLLEEARIRAQKLSAAAKALQGELASSERLCARLQLSTVEHAPARAPARRALEPIESDFARAPAAPVDAPPSAPSVSSGSRRSVRRSYRAGAAALSRATPPIKLRRR